MKKVFLIFFTSVMSLMGCSGVSPKLGVKNGQLMQCPSTPNCVSSQAIDEKHFIEPIIITSTAEEAKEKILNVVGEFKRSEVKAANSNYIRAEFTSLFLRFVDDVEFYFPDTSSKKTLIHIRSASRLGYSDLGVNRKRVKELRNKLELINDR